MPNYYHDEATCDEPGCENLAVTDRKVIFAYTQLCGDHAAAYDARQPQFPHPYPRRLEQIRIGRN